MPQLTHRVASVLLSAAASLALPACSDDADALPPPPTNPVTAWSARADAERVLDNPHKGLYHHYYDDAGTRYGGTPADLAAVPGLDHLYLRVPWAQLEPVEDDYDWALLDDIIAAYPDLGYAFAFTTKETAIEYATPRWVREKGAGGTEIVGVPWDPNQRVWEPDYGDAVYQAELRDFQKAVAARYGEESRLRYVQIAAYGSWGEGHNWPATDRIYPYEVQTALIDIYTETFPDNVLLTITDDWYGNVQRPVNGVAPEAFRQNLRQYVESRGITYSDHSPLVNYYVQEFPATFSIRSPELFEAVYESTPVPIELEHYGNIKNDGNWTQANGTGGYADLVRGALATTHATWVGYHGYAAEWLADNPALARELANRVGYWLFVDDAAAAMSARTLRLNLTLRNAGWAPVYEPAEVQVRLTGPTTRTISLGEAGLRGIDTDEARALTLTRELPPDVAAGEYTVGVQLVDRGGSARRIDVALAEEWVDGDGYWDVGTVVVP